VREHIEVETVALSDKLYRKLKEKADTRWTKVPSRWPWRMWRVGGQT